MIENYDKDDKPKPGLGLKKRKITGPQPFSNETLQTVKEEELEETCRDEDFSEEFLEKIKEKIKPSDILEEKCREMVEDEV